MKKTFIFLTLLLTVISGKVQPLFAAQYDYQNYNHGYCPECDNRGCGLCNNPPTPAQDVDQLPPETPPPCSTPPPAAAPCAPAPCAPAPCAPAPCDAPCAASVCGPECGISMCAIGVGVIALCIAGAIIVSSGNGSDPAHQ